MNTSQQLEAILFYKGEPETKKNLAKLLSVDEATIEAGITELKEALQGRGVALVEHEGTYELRTAPETTELIAALRKQELNRDLGKAGAETLAIVLYKGPVARSEIDYIRGVNSSFILRNLLIRGLIDRASMPGNQRSFVYTPTLELLSHLGVSGVEELPDYHTMQRELTVAATTEEENV